MTITEVIGYTGAAMSALIFLPQVIKTVRTKETKSLSLATFTIMTISNTIWATYAILTKEPAIMMAQVFLWPMGVTILGYKIKYG